MRVREKEREKERAYVSERERQEEIQRENVIEKERPKERHRDYVSERDIPPRCLIGPPLYSFDLLHKRGPPLNLSYLFS